MIMENQLVIEDEVNHDEFENIKQPTKTKDELKKFLESLKFNNGEKSIFINIDYIQKLSFLSNTDDENIHDLFTEAVQNAVIIYPFDSDKNSVFRSINRKLLICSENYRNIFTRLLLYNYLENNRGRDKENNNNNNNNNKTEAVLQYMSFHLFELISKFI